MTAKKFAMVAIGKSLYHFVAISNLLAATASLRQQLKK